MSSLMDSPDLRFWRMAYILDQSSLGISDFVTQCPITSGDSFLYNFSVPDQAGTFWYHSHLATQYCDGLRGAFIVYDPDDPHKYLYDEDNEDTIITLSDWYHTLAKQTKVPATPQSTLINGKGRYSNQTIPSELAVVTVQQGKRYRMRLVSLSCDPEFRFSIDSHDLTVIEADGENTRPHRVDSISIFAAQRYSFILNANQSIKNYWIRAKPGIGNDTFAGGLNSAILRYAGAPLADPTTAPTPNNTELIETDLRPLDPSGVPGQPVSGGADVNLNLLFNFTGTVFSVNNVNYLNPNIPTLLQIMSGAQTAQDLLPAGEYFALPSNSVIEISMPGGVIGGGHPLHLHGHTFHVVRSAGSEDYNYDDPVMRDVVNIGTKGDNVTIRFVTDNPGPWFLHCHINWHFNIGFAVVMAEDILGAAPANPVPDAWRQLCPKYNSLAPGDL
ncbi:laccase, multicopper oxidase, benzenediol:oxygen oxidorectuctase [Steccherinum ochraceum]|uniref:laccase n=1 Tax=Steccherinum ochraceum TaxID=92696 RepID=A0A4R0RBU3_9APHY|nr:laccase, multicopper oxidase, benzenediol:oxygen oxidorectuctase [Steccherinum ochraceum]